MFSVHDKQAAREKHHSREYVRTKLLSSQRPQSRVEKQHQKWSERSNRICKVIPPWLTQTHPEVYSKDPSTVSKPMQLIQSSLTITGAIFNIHINCCQIENLMSITGQVLQTYWQVTLSPKTLFIHILNRNIVLQDT